MKLKQFDADMTKASDLAPFMLPHMGVDIGSAMTQANLDEKRAHLQHAVDAHEERVQQLERAHRKLEGLPTSRNQRCQEFGCVLESVWDV